MKKQNLYLTISAVLTLVSLLFYADISNQSGNHSAWFGTSLEQTICSNKIESIICLGILFLVLTIMKQAAVYRILHLILGSICLVVTWVSLIYFCD